MKTLSQEIILLGPQDGNPWLIDSISKALIILDILEGCKNETQMIAIERLLDIGANASLDIMGDIYAILSKTAGITMRSKYDTLDVIEKTFLLPNVRLEFMSIIDKFKLRPRK